MQDIMSFTVYDENYNDWNCYVRVSFYVPFIRTNYWNNDTTHHKCNNIIWTRRKCPTPMLHHKGWKEFCKFLNQQKFIIEIMQVNVKCVSIVCQVTCSNSNSWNLILQYWLSSNFPTIKITPGMLKFKISHFRIYFAILFTTWIKIKFFYSLNLSSIRSSDSKTY